jgi:hypothetical protein
MRERGIIVSCLYASLRLIPRSGALMTPRALYPAPYFTNFTAILARNVMAFLCALHTQISRKLVFLFGGGGDFIGESAPEGRGELFRGH